jgi:hypothetical protein
MPAPPQTYTEKLKTYKCQQYDGTNYDDLAAWAPMTQHDGKVYLIVPHVGDVEVPVGYWVMEDIYNFFQPLSDEMFQKGYKPGGQPVQQPGPFTAGEWQ